MNIIDLNNKLFETLQKLETGEIEIKNAQAIVNVSNAISNNAKLMLNMAKFSQNRNITNQLLGESNAKNPEIVGDLYQRKTSYAMQLGYKNIPEAYEKMGKLEFENEFKKHDQ